MSEQTIRINGTDYKVVPIEYDRFKNMVEYIKRGGVNLNYGASSNFPISIDYPKGFDSTCFDKVGINIREIPRDKWFKY